VKKKSQIRTYVQVAFFILIGLIAVNHSLEESGKRLIPFLSSASLHAVCPLGGVVSIYQVLISGSFVKKVHESSFILMWIAFILAVGFGPVFCGWICPFGTFQEFLSKIGLKIFKKRFNHFVPEKADNIFRYLRYIFLIRILITTAKTGKLAFTDADPYYALFQFWTGEVAVTAFVFLGIVMVLSLFIERPFCKYACPFGAVQGVFNLFRIFGIKRNKTTCINCGACDRACPMNIKVSDKSVVRNHQCISCYKCTSEQACPVTETVEMRAGSFKEVQS